MLFDGHATVYDTISQHHTLDLHRITCIIESIRINKYEKT